MAIDVSGEAEKALTKQTQRTPTRARFVSAPRDPPYKKLCFETARIKAGNSKRTFARDGRAQQERGDDKFISSIVHRSGALFRELEGGEREEGRDGGRKTKARGEKYSQTFSEA